MLLAGLLLLPGCAKKGFSGDPAADFAYCLDQNKLKLKIERDRCLHNLAIREKDPNMCSYITGEWTSSSAFTIIDDAVTKNIRNDCYFQVAQRMADAGFASLIAAQVCENIEAEAVNDIESGNSLLRDQCFYEVAIITLDSSICSRISDEATKEYGANPVYDPATGDLIGYESYDRSFQEICEEEVIARTS